jgi:hypothetical protein
MAGVACWHDPTGAGHLPAPTARSDVADIELVDLEVIARYSLAIRQASAPAHEVLAALEESKAFVLALLDGASVEEADARALVAAAEPEPEVDEPEAEEWLPEDEPATVDDEVDEEPEEDDEEEAEPEEEEEKEEVFARPRGRATGTPVVRPDEPPTVAIDASRAADGPAEPVAAAAPHRRGLLRRKPAQAEPPASPTPPEPVRAVARDDTPPPEPTAAPVRAVPRDDPTPLPKRRPPAAAAGRGGDGVDERQPLSAEEAAARRAARRARREVRAQRNADQ